LVFLFIYLFIVGFYERRDLFQFHSGITAGCNVISASVQEMCLSHDRDVARLHKRNKSAISDPFPFRGLNKLNNVFTTTKNS